jgi:uncharacterized RDD family membrane protein YckC
MKCPKCGYLGFETVDRCRNCGYDFSLSTDRPGAELPLREVEDTGHPLSDFELGNREATKTPAKSALDLDRLIGVPESEPFEENAPAPEPPRIMRRPETEPTPLLDAAERAAEERGGHERIDSLPLFGGPRDHDSAPAASEEPPFVAPPRPAGPPLAVRRATPEVARPRNRAPRTTRRDEPPLAFPMDRPLSTGLRDVDDEAPAAVEDSPFQAAPRIRRIVAALIDAGLLAGICAGVLYLTLRLADLTFADVRVLPVIPMAAFLILLVAGYLIAFTAAGGQTIGKMATHIKVIADDGRPVDVSAAVLRMAGNAVNIATLGLVWLPVLFAADTRSLADRLAGTRVVRA